MIMKTFEQFLSEAEFASRRDIKGAERVLRGAHGTINKSAKQKAKEKKERANRLSNLPAGTGTSGSDARRHIESQLAAQKKEAEKNATQQQPAVQHRGKPEQLSIKYMRSEPGKGHIPLSLDAKLIPKPPRLPRSTARPKSPKPKTRQLRLRGT